MRKSIIIALTMLMAGTGAITAQRTMDVLDRGLVAVKTTDGVLCTWRIPGEEWYGVKYNIYRDGTKLNNTPLDVSNYVDKSGTTSATYTVRAVVRGVEQAACKPVKVWEKNYMTIVPKHDPSLTSTYVPNDACCADVDGDGEVEILMKYDNESEISASYPYGGHNGEYSLFECLKLDGTVLWWVNCGPNMGDFQNNEQNIVGYDWDQDGKAEVIFRAADGTQIHMADGTVYTVGDPKINYRGATGGGANWFMHSGREYLLYVNGETGKPYVDMEYPLPRLEADENPEGLLSGGAYDGLVNKAWGDGYGHRSTKHFFGAPYLDGRHPSIFLARGIYTRHKMVAYDVDPATHKLIERWRWNCNEGGEWYGQGYHNYSIADVDWDGRDEIVFGSMVIDDNGKGLSTTGLGHGDSHHVGDFDPYSHGQEVFACNEDRPNNNFRDATTSKIYYRTTGGNDDGRANCGNFIDEYPGAQALSSRDNNLIGCASHTGIDGDNKGSVTITQNFRIYWDGDLCDESFDYNSGKNSQGAIFKARSGRIAILEGSRTNNDTKGTPCQQADIFGDWREEVIMRDASNNIRIYTTDQPTPWRNYSLWHDHQYRNAVVWQMCGYNQTPHVSYYLGEFEGITEAPAPLTMTGRTEVANNQTIGNDANDKHIIICETNDMNVKVGNGVKPYVLTVNTPSWVQGHNSNTFITTTYYTHTLEGGAFAGEMRLVKQGDGTLVLPNVTETYTGDTEVWAGTLAFDGTMQGSHLWLNRFAKLNTVGGKFPKGIDMNYAAELNIGTGEAAGTVETDVLTLGFGSIVNIDMFSSANAADCIKANVLKIEKKDWKNGPQYLAPIVKLNAVLANGETALADGKYLIAEVAKIEGNLNDLILQGLDSQKKTLTYENGKLYIEVQKFETSLKNWVGGDNAAWDLDNTASFSTPGSGESVVFVPGDEVVFDDSAVSTTVNVVGNVAPASIKFSNDTKNYVLTGEGRIVGETSLVKEGEGKLTVNNINEYTGGTYINGGILEAGVFSNAIGTDVGALSDIESRIYISNNATLRPTASATLGQRVSIQSGNATIDTPNGVELTMARGISSPDPFQTLYKTGAGTLTLGEGNGMRTLVINGGKVNSVENGSSVIQLPNTVEFVSGSLYDANSIYSYSTNPANFVVNEGNTGTIYLDARCNYTGKLTGAGTFNVYATSVRNYLQGDWSEFTGKVSCGYSKMGSYDPQFLWDNKYGLPKGTLDVRSGVTFESQSSNIEVGNLSGSGVMSVSGTITVGGKNEPLTYSGSYAGNPKLVKIGTGDWKVTRVISGLSSITVKDGTFSLGASKIETNVCTSPLFIEENALMRGRGTVSNLTVRGGGVLQPGYYDNNRDVHYGPVYVQGDLVVESDATIAFYIRKADGMTNSRSFVSTTGNITINGKVIVQMDPDWTPQIGDQIDLWDTKSFTGNPTFELPTLPEGYSWDYAGLKDATGIIKVTADSGISDVDNIGTLVQCYVYNTAGIQVATLEATPRTVVDAVRALNIPTGVYLVKMTDGTSIATISVSK